MKEDLRYIHEVIDVVLPKGNYYIIDGYIYKDSSSYKIIPCQKCGVPYYGKTLGDFPTKKQAQDFLEELEIKITKGDQLNG